MTDKTYDFGGKRKSFKPIELDGIARGAVAPLCLDDQWIKQKSYRKKLQPIHNPDNRAALRELKKSLIFAPQVVVNRAFVLNTPTITGLLDRKSKDRSDMLRLLNDHVIALYVWKNEDPLLGSETNLEKSSKGERVWLEACQEVSPACVRFAWNNADEDAKFRTNKLEGMFKKRVKNLAITDPATIGLAIDPTINQDKLDVLKDVFEQLSAFCRSEKVDRTSLYKRFVWSDDPPLDGRGGPIRLIDYGKPCVIEIKQILDLIYNTNLTDALQISALTPAGSLDRSILSEDPDPGQFVPMSGERAAAFVQRLYTEMRLPPDRPFGFENMSLKHIRQLRESPAWADYQVAKLHVSEIANFPNFEKFEDECIHRTVIANEKFKGLCKEAHREFGKYYVRTDAPIQNLTRATFRMGGQELERFIEAIGGVVGGPVEMAAGSAIGILAAERVKALIQKKAHQTIETRVAMGIGAARHAFFLPRIGWNNNEVEARKFVAELQRMGFGQNLSEVQLELFPPPSTIGYELKSEAPKYG